MFFQTRHNYLAKYLQILTVSIDSYYYGKFVFASLNIVLYNVFSSHGPELYGTEPLSYYLYNLFLNFNVAFLLSLCSVVTLLVSLFVTSKGWQLFTDSSLMIFVGSFLAKRKPEHKSILLNCSPLSVVLYLFSSSTQRRTVHVPCVSVDFTGSITCLVQYSANSDGSIA